MSGKREQEVATRQDERRRVARVGLVRAAVDQIEHTGAFTLRGVADRMGWMPNAVYHHYPRGHVDLAPDVADEIRRHRNESAAGPGFAWQNGNLQLAAWLELYDRAHTGAPE